MKYIYHVLIIFLLLFLYGCTSEKQSWEEIQDSYSIEAYQNFLIKYPNSDKKHIALEKIEYLTYFEAEIHNSIKELQKYLALYPNGKYKKEVNLLLDEIDYNEAIYRKTKESLKKYLANHPNGKYKVQVQSLIKNITFKELISLKSEKALQEYLLTNPDEKESVLTAIQGLNKAIVKIDYPKILQSTVGDYEFNTNFFELGGSIGYELTSCDEITVSNGSKYTSGVSRSIIVKPGGSGTIHYSFHIMGGRKFQCIWYGKDEKGNSIRIIQNVKLSKKNM
jgi:hypothetical protein